MDKPKTRHEAKLAGAPKYFTGEPCRNGHVAARYTQSGTCQECISVSMRKGASHQATSAQQKGAILQQLVDVRLRAYPSNIDSLRRLAAILLQLRYPQMLETDAWCSSAGTHGAAGTLLYKFKAHPEDVQFLQQTAANQLTAMAPQVNIAAERQRIFGKIYEEMDSEPEFRP